MRNASGARIFFYGLFLLALSFFAGCANFTPTPSAAVAPTLTGNQARKTRQAEGTATPRNIATVLARAPNESGVPVLAHGPLAGAVTFDRAKIWVQTHAQANVQVRYSTQPDLADAKLSDATSTDPDQNFTAQIELNNLKSSAAYYYDILVDGASQLRAPYARFKTFPQPGETRDFTFVQLTDFSASPELTAQTFAHADNENPDFVIIGGDFPHGKLSDLESKRVNFELMYDTRTSPSIADFVTRILRRYAVAHMWDDHDYGMNNGDKTYPLKATSLRVLREMFPTYAMTQYGDWQKFSYAQADFFMLDSRSQRDPNTLPDGPEKSMLDGDNLGTAGQLEWLKQGLQQSTAQWKFIISPVIFNQTAKLDDGWAAFAREHDDIVKFARDNQITGIIVLSGDLHAGGIDDGTHSGFPEMVNNGPNGGGCLSGNPGQWSAGMYASESGPCNGYGVVHVLTNPPRVELQVKDDAGRTRASLIVPLEMTK